MRKVAGSGTGPEDVVEAPQRSVRKGARLWTILCMPSSKSRVPSGDLRERRLACGLTQQRLAALAGVSIASIALYEAGYTPTRSRHVLERVLAVLDEERPADGPGAQETARQGRHADPR